MYLIDFEASGLQPGCYPIEVAVVRAADGWNRCWLVMPTYQWLQHGHWDPAAQDLHGLTREILLEFGCPVVDLAAELAPLLAGQDVYCDSMEHDGAWLDQLLEVGGRSERIHMLPVEQAYGRACRPLLEGAGGTRERGAASAIAMHLVARAETAEEARRADFERRSRALDSDPETLRLRNVRRHQAAADAISLWMTYKAVGQLVDDWIAEHR